MKRLMLGAAAAVTVLLNSGVLMAGLLEKFQRPGDEFLQDEQELKFVDDEDVDGDKKIDIRYPMWTYRPKNVKLDIRDLDTVLRNARRETEQSPEN